MKRVTILGCGPSGLLAAHAFALKGWEVNIISRKIPSKIGGAQYIHRAIPFITGTRPDGLVSYVKVGTRDGYAEKVYGDTRAEVSWDLYDGNVPIWNMRRVYSKLWDLYEASIEPGEASPAMVADLSRKGLVVSSIPLVALCITPERHEFTRQPVFIVQMNTNAGGMPEHVILYDGIPEHQHYRYSRIFGVESWEFAMPSASEIEGVVHIQKPISTTCDCHPLVVKVGRYGKWEKSQLAHNAFEDGLEVADGL